MRKIEFLSMDRDVNTHLFDVVECCKRILEFVENLDFEVYNGSELVKSAVERQFINIGESLSRINQVDSTVFRQIT